VFRRARDGTKGQQFHDTGKIGLDGPPDHQALGSGARCAVGVPAHATGDAAARSNLNGLPCAPAG
jgi:hypothetical protein